MDAFQSDAPPSIFLSYARTDDDEFVARLHGFLVREGFRVWWDRQDMPNRALTFTEEIRNAVHHADRLLVVIGPRALESDYVRAEWQAALSENKPVVPLVRRVPQGTNDFYELLPAELGYFHAPNFVPGPSGEPPLDPLVKLLREPVPPPVPVFGRVPELPPHFRPRPGEFTRLSENVLGELTTTKVRTGSDRVTVLSGMGGIGKTVLAASLVHAMRSRPSTFLADGIYWLDRTPLQQLARLAAVPADVDEGVVEAGLKSHFAGKRFLLVVDGATSTDQIAPLVRILQSSGRLLVTTRHGELGSGRRPVHLDRLTESEALLLAADWVGQDPEKLPEEARQVLKMCGFHPFAIAINAAAVSNNLSWESIAKALENRELDYARHSFDEYVYDTVEKSIRISLDDLEGTIPAASERYRELAAFFWDSGVPAATLGMFWERHKGVASHHADRLLMLFKLRSLINVRGDGRAATVHLHDLHRAFIERDEDEVRVLNEALLAAYRPPAGNEWWNVPDDGYLQDHLFRHLDRTRSKEEIVALLAAESRSDVNAWYPTRIASGGLGGYLIDLQLAASGNTHYLPALIASSLISLAKATPGDLLAAAVRQERWPLARAMAYARLAAPEIKRAPAMIALFPFVTDRTEWLEEVLGTLDRIDMRERGLLVQRLVQTATDAEMMAILRHVTGWHVRAESPYEHTQSVTSINAVLAQVKPTFAADALHVIEGTSIKPLRLYAFLPEPERSRRIERVLARARGKSGEMGTAVYAMTVSGLADQMGREAVGARLPEALGDVLRLEPESVLRREALIDLLPHLDADQQGAVFEELLADAREKEPRLFARLAAVVRPSFHERVRLALEQQDLAWIADAAPELASEQREALLDRALAEIEQRENATSLLWMDRAKLLTGMSDQQLERAAALAEARLEGPAKVGVLSAVAFRTSGAGRDAAVARALRAIDQLNDTDQRATALQDLGPLLFGPHLDEALAGAQRIGEPSGRNYMSHLLASTPSAAPRGRSSERERNAIPSDLTVDDACTYLAELIQPEPDNRLELARIRGKHTSRRQFSYVKEERRAGVAAALVERLFDLGAADVAFDVLRHGKKDAVTLTALVALAPALADEQVKDIERWIRAGRLPGALLD